MSSLRITLNLARQRNALFPLTWTSHSCRNVSQQPPRANFQNAGTFKLALIGIALGAASGTAFSIYNNWKNKTAHLGYESISPKVIDTFPDGIQITKRFVNPNNKTGLELVLFQFQTCPFCCKVRAFLDFNGIPYSIVEVDAVLRQDIRWSEQKKVPILLIKQDDGRWLQMSDSSAIISLIASYLNNTRNDVIELAQFYQQISYFDDFGKNRHDVMNKYFLMFQENVPSGFSKEAQENERKWRTWADNHLVHLVSPNCYQTLREALETFEWFSQAGEWNIHFPQWERNIMVYVGAPAMWAISKVLKNRHGLSDDVRSQIYDALEKWTNELKRNKTKFLGGEEPNLADLSVFGILCSMEGCTAFKDCLENTNIGEWFYNVKKLVEEHRCKPLYQRVEGNTHNSLEKHV